MIVYMFAHTMSFAHGPSFALKVVADMVHRVLMEKFSSCYPGIGRFQNARAKQLLLQQWHSLEVRLLLR